jgi:hypothetical protein
MYTMICTYTLEPGSGAQLKQRLQAEYESLISRLPGLVSYCLLWRNAEQVISINIFDSKGHADLSSGPLGFCMRKVLDDCILGRPEIVSGQTEVESTIAARVSRGTRQQHRPAEGHGALDGDPLSVSHPGSTSFTVGRAYHLPGKIPA